MARKTRSENQAIRDALSQAAREESAHAPVRLRGREHDPRVTLDVSLAAIVRNTSIPVEVLTGRGPKRHYAKRVFDRAQVLLRERLGWSPIAERGGVYYRASQGDEASEGDRAASSLVDGRGMPRPAREQEIVELCCGAAYRVETHFFGNMLTSREETHWLLLDDRLSKYGGARGRYQVSGIRVLRYLCYKLGVKQPDKAPEESDVPSLEQLENEIARAKRDTPSTRN